MTEPSQAHIDRARELGLSFDPSDTSDEELSRAIATYERVYIEAMTENAGRDTDTPTERRKMLGVWTQRDEEEAKEAAERRRMFGSRRIPPGSIDDVRNPG